MTIDLRERASTRSTRAALPTPTLRAVEGAGRTRTILLLVVASGIGAALMSDASPVGLTLADGIYRSLFAGVVVWSASRARRWTWPIIAGLATVTTASLFGQAASALVLAVAVSRLVQPGRRNGVIGAAIAAVSVPALMTQGVGPIWRLSGGRMDDRFATSAVIVFAACAPVVASAWKTLSRRRRRMIRRTGLRVLITIGAVATVAGASAAAAMPSMLSGLEHSRSATQAANDGDLGLATSEFDAAAARWSSANTTLTRAWMTPARLIPVVGQHVRAAQVVTGQAAALNSSAALLTDRLDPDALVVEGAVVLDELDALTPAADALAATTERAHARIDESRSDWLIPPLAGRMDRAVEVLGQSSGIAGAASEGLHAAGDLLGRQTPAQILIMVATPAEARGAGGFVGNWVLLESTDGLVRVLEQYQSRDLNSLLEEKPASLRGDAQFADRYGRFDVESHIQDVTLSPDFPTVARVASDLFAQATNIDVEAVLMVDPFVLEKLLGFTGPIDIGGDVPLTGANASRHLLVEQYQQFEFAETQREAGLLGLTESLAATLLAEPPDPIAFVTELAPLVEQNRMSLWLADDPEGTIVDRLGLSGAFPTSSDALFAVVHQNAGQNKIDPYLQRSVDLRTVLSPSTGVVRHQVTVTLDNTAPSGGLADAVIASNDQGLDPGTNRMLLSVYSSDRLRSARLDGRPAAIEHASEFDVSVYTVVVEVGPGDFSILELELEGHLTDSASYEMTFDAQPLAVPDDVSWRLTTDDGSRIVPPDGWSVRADGVRWAAPLDRPEVIEFSLGD